MINPELKKIIENNAVSLATCSKTEPHVIIVNGVKVVSDNEILITDNYMKVTISNIKSNNHVSLAVWDNEKGYCIEGLASYHTSGEWLDQVKSLEENEELPAKGAILVKVNTIKRLVG